MKQFQLQQVKFPKPQVQSEPNVHPSQSIPKSTAQSQMIRIIIALLIAIFIFNSSQETTINYNEIIKNQKMFLVKNIRGVIPTLSGDIYKLQDYWKVVHFENYRQNDSEIFTNFTLLFNGTSLVVENKYCNTHLVYDWKNYSYNIDFSLLVDNTKPITMLNLEHNNNVNSESSNLHNTRQLQDTLNALTQPILDIRNAADRSQAHLEQTSDSNQSVTTQTSNQTNLTISTLPKENLSNSVSFETQGTSKKLSLEQQKCTNNINYFKQVIVFTSVYTISNKNLYLLMENANTDEDFYMILRPME